ncbi:MAG TPA: YCF48-related protein [Pyrinomonadaceae bacterium]|nr:YCF48-related protein [Pyrinomonadaceae bacterium]
MNIFKTIIFVLLCFVCFQTARADWLKQNLNTLAWLHDVYFVNEKTGWIAGSNGTLFATNDGGKTWKKEKLLTEDNIRQVYFSDEFTGWLLCERNIFNRGANASSYILKTTNGGIDWEKIEFQDIKRERLVKLFFNSENQGFAIGESGAFYALRDAEEKWKRQASPAKFLLLDGTFADAKNGVIVGASGSIFFTEDAGETWKPSSIFNNPTAKFNSVFFLDSKIGWTAGTQGKIFQTTNGGKTWREQTSGVTKNLNDIFFTSQNKGWAIGDEGTVLYTNSAGNVWILKESKIKHKFEKIFFNGNKGWIVGFGGTVLLYDAETSQTQKPVLKK